MNIYIVGPMGSGKSTVGKIVARSLFLDFLDSDEEIEKTTGASIDWIVAALVHDIGDELAPLSHSEFAAALLKPFVSEEIVWVIEKHGLFQAYYYAHHVGGDRHARDKYKDHPFYDQCVHFCEAWDQASFDPNYPTRSLDYFEPMVREVFSRRAH